MSETILRLWTPVALTIMALGVFAFGASLFVGDTSPAPGDAIYGLVAIFVGFSMFGASGLYLIWRYAITGKSPLD